VKQTACALIERVGWPFRGTAILIFVASVFLATLVWSIGDRPPGWYPPCVLHALTGLNCPGCGSSRAVHAFMHGEWLIALHDNALFALALPLLSAWSVVALWRALRRNQPPLELPLGMARIVLLVTIAFVVARNLPWWPCTLLAPLAS
jgi:hypothetical protein